MSPEWTSALPLVLLDSSVRVVVVAALVALILGATRVRSSGIRHGAWASVLFAMLLMPVLPRVVPSFTVAVPAPLPQLEVLSVAPQRSTTPGVAAVSILLPDTPSRSVRFTAREQAVAALPATPLWPVLLLAAYGAVMLALLFRLFAGWRAMWRLARSASPALRAFGVQVYESKVVATPVTAGLLSPRIILPPAWKTWSADTLRAILAHECEHVTRRDPLIAFLAHVNRCLFWFHPLAWWLERTLASTAEHACDDAAVRQTGERRRYAEALLDMADAVRRNRGRLAWEGIGVDGGLLGRRIERILAGAGASETSLARKLIVAVSCAAIIFVVVACRQQLTAAPLREDPEVAERLARQKADQEMYESARSMTAEQVTALEASLKRTPADFDGLKTLRYFYQARGQQVFGWNEMIARRRPHILWLIEHHPEHELAVWRVSSAADPAGYAEAKKAWLAQTTKRNATAATLTNAAMFFEEHETASAEELLLRAKAVDPDGRTVRRSAAADPATYWSRRLGSFYARAILGPRSPRDGSPLRRLSDDRYAQDVRRRLEASEDVVLLTTAGTDVFRRSWRDPERQQVGKQFLERAIALNPQSDEARRVLAMSVRDQQDIRRRDAVRLKQAELAGGDLPRKLRTGERLTDDEMARMSAVEYDATVALPEEDRLPALAGLADLNYMGAEYQQYTKKDDATAARLWSQSKRAATDALALAQKYRDHPDHAETVYRANVALGAHALREGDRNEAVRYMREAVKAPSSERLSTGLFVSLDSRLVNYLLKEGERQSVAEFLEGAARLKTSQRERLLKDAAAIRAGVMPMSFQYMMTRGG